MKLKLKVGMNLSISKYINELYCVVNKFRYLNKVIIYYKI